MEVDVFMLVSNFGRFVAALLVGCLIIGGFVGLMYWSEREQRRIWKNWDRE